MAGTTQAAINSFFTAPSKKKAFAAALPANHGTKRSRSASPDGTTQKKREVSDAEKETELKEAETFLQSVESSSTSLKNVQPGGSLPYSSLSDLFDKLSSTTKRLEMNSMASHFFLEVLKTSPHELSRVTYLCVNKLGPDYEGLELGLGESLIQKALSEATGKPLAQVKNDYQKVGDLGQVALQARGNQPTMFAPKPLTVEEVFKVFTEIAKISGQSSQVRRIGMVKRLLTACKGNEAKYIVRSLLGTLRVGMAEKSILVALSQAFVAWEFEKQGKTPKVGDIIQGEEIFKEVYSRMPNYEVIINSAMKHGILNLVDYCNIAPGIPMKPMLAKPTKSITEILDRFQGVKFTCEYKYDGERAQVHATQDGKIKIYSRNMEDMTQRYPDLAGVMPRFLNDQNKSFILDCEAVAWDKEESKILPFQVLSTRKRKDVEQGSIKVRVCLFVFDILYFNGESLLHKTLSERRQIIKDHFSEVDGEFRHAQSMNSENVDDIQAFLDQSIKDKCEGLMIKVLETSESEYEPSKRSRNWLKLKKDYLEGIGDTLDLVVLGAYHGRGKRTTFYGGYLLGCYNPDSEEYETVCKLGTGFSDENLEAFYNQLSQTVISEPKGYYKYADSATPDVWFEPTTVWEILAADFSLSPVYKAGIDKIGEKGISLRFPRFIRVRDDKQPEESTSSDQLVEMYLSQASLN